jgi:hypothetical protein
VLRTSRNTNKRGLRIFVILATLSIMNLQEL